MLIITFLRCSLWYNISMNEKYPNRREAMASEIEQGEKYQAMQALLELGICQKVNDLELYHGRVGNGGEWQVDPSYNNASNSTGNRNINKIPALNTGEYGVARDFSRARASRDGGIPEIHRVIASDQDAMVISSGLSGLNEEGRIRVSKAISSLCPRIMEGAPIDFKHRNDLDKILPRDFRNRYGFMFEDDISDIESRTGLDRELITHVGSAMNTMRILESGFLYTIGEAFNDDKLNLYAKEKDGALYIIAKENPVRNYESGFKYHTIPLNREYIANFFRNSHIVGLKLPVNSATLDKDIDNYIMFDLAKVNTPEFIGRTVRDRNRYFGEIATEIHKRSEGNPRTKGELLRTLESNLYIKPHEIINIAKRTPGFNDIFEADAGNWEGFKLGEHTETVLRLFDDNYADSIPASTLPIMRLALLVHDIGKPEAVRKGDKKSQKRYNVAYRRRVYATKRHRR